MFHWFFLYVAVGMLINTPILRTKSILIIRDRIAERHNLTDTRVLTTSLWLGAVLSILIWPAIVYRVIRKYIPVVRRFIKRKR